MDAYTSAASDDARAIRFTGNWREYLPIAIVNLLLTIVTLGIYRFWAKAKVRRYLWSKTHVIDDPLEWTGTGGEMFVGFLIVIGGLIVTYLLVAGVIIGLLAAKLAIIAIPLMIAVYVGAIWFIGFAQFRALRYRLSRSWWRGIRGGSDHKGGGYANGALGRTVLAGITGGILYPHALVGNWDDRWNRMSFGPHAFNSACSDEGLQGRWMAIYGMGALAAVMFAAGDSLLGEGGQVLFILAFYAAIGLAAVFFWSKFFRNAADGLSVGGLSMGFPVSSKEWLKFYIYVACLTIVTLGLASIMWGFLRWQFVTDRLHLYGVIDLDELTQSTTVAPTDAEGFADAFDIGAF